MRLPLLYMRTLKCNVANRIIAKKLSGWTAKVCFWHLAYIRTRRANVRLWGFSRL
jgi:hypothetical protein